MTSHVRHVRAGRRGALLLLVLGVLTMFMMIGTLMLVLATRTRESARAFAAASGATAVGALQTRAVLDEALMVLLRGKADQTGLPTEMQSESLLEDRYGPGTTIGSAPALTVGLFSNVNVRAGPLLQAKLGGLTPPVTHPCELNGRVITFTPEPGDGDVASYRILRTTGAAEPFTVYLANTPGKRVPVLPRRTCRVVINGREFGGTAPADPHEPYDAFDDRNRFLTRPVLANAAPTSVSRAAFQPAGASLQVDNDGDGVADGVWLSGVVANRPAPSGGSFTYRVSCLVLDLDGRLNVNAHGTLVPTTLPTDWLASDASINLALLPVGLGYGPADVDLSRLLAGPTPTSPPAVPGFPDATSAAGVTPTGDIPGTRLRNLLRGENANPRSVLLNTPATTTVQRLPPAWIGSTAATPPIPLEGRYGLDFVPGTAGAMPPAWLRPWIIGSGTAASPTSPTDLQARVKAYVRTNPAGGPPTLMFYVPNPSEVDLASSPYELRLDAEGVRDARLRSVGTPPADNPFTLAELERVLRPFDPDARTLPQRLATLLDEYGERCRLTATTDSWDTPALAGAAMQRVETFMCQFPAPTVAAASLPGGAAGAMVYDVVSPDVSAGLRFDVNRPLEYPGTTVITTPQEGALVKQRYCRHLFTLLRALGANADTTTAQWAANACDFRDNDSTMTRFWFDATPTNGWSPAATDVVMGMERPEVLITETVAWNGAAFVVLFHPWDARVLDRSGGAGASVEAVDPALAPAAAPTANRVDIRRRNGAGNSVWRLRVDPGPTLALGDVPRPTSWPAGVDGPGPNSYLLVQTADTSGTTVFSDQEKLAASSFNPGAPGNKRVFLERLADPTAANVEDTADAAFNPYVVVDVAPLNVANDRPSAVKQQRATATFWRPDFGAGGGNVPAKYTDTNAPWFHWPNRPFVSVAELALVPSGNALDALRAFNAAPTASATFASLGLFDAVHVPSRFRGTSFRVGGDAMLRLAVLNERVVTTQLPRWREPGRINVNTILANTGNSTLVNSTTLVAGVMSGTSRPLPALDDAVWKALAVGGPAANPFTPAAPADSFTKLLALGTAREPAVDTVAAPRNRNPFFAYANAIRLANSATIRSHVFAIWITVEVTDTSPGAAPPTYARLFAIVDRSIPVGFNRGENANVRDTVRLLRFLE